jgi:DNA-binding beta-propeller fold protein YncE
VASDSGYTGTTASIKRGAPPFNRPTNVAVAPSGDLYVCDGYGNARVQRFSPDGKLIQSWGEPGGAPGLFNLPHGIRVAADGRVLVADRENDRIQFFSPTGEYICEWTQVQRPTDIFIDPAGLIYVSELTWRVGQHSFRRGDAAAMEPGRVTVFDPDGNVLARIGGNADVTAPGNFVAPHCICVDAAGDIYVGEVTNTFGIKTGFVPEGSHMFQKFTRA